jgi:hypothetical protein
MTSSLYASCITGHVACGLSCAVSVYLQGPQQLSDAQLAAALDASDLHMPYLGGAAFDLQQQPQLSQQQQQQQQVSTGRTTTAVAAAAATATLGPAAAAAAAAAYNRTQQPAGFPADIALLASHREAAAAAPTGYGAAAVAPPAAWVGNRPPPAAAAAAAAAGSAAVLQPGDDVIVTLQLFESGLDSQRHVMQELQVGHTLLFTVWCYLVVFLLSELSSLSHGSCCGLHKYLLCCAALTHVVLP